MLKNWVSTCCLILPLMAAAAQDNTFSIVPRGDLPTTVPAHGKVIVNYTITNMTDTTLANIGLRPGPNGQTPQGVTQISAVPNCTDPFTLKAGESCNLMLMVKADDLEDHMATGGPEICNASPLPVRCSVPEAINELNIHVVDATEG